MVKNHSKKNDARNLIANTGQNLTSALTAVSGDAKPSYLSTLTYPSKTWHDGHVSRVTPASFISWVDEYIGIDTVRQFAYDEMYNKGLGNGSEIAKLHDDFGYGFDDSTSDEISKFVPTSAQLIEHYGTWHEACIVSGIKTFNGYIVSYTLDEQKYIVGGVTKEPTAKFTGSLEGVQDWPSWISIIAEDIVEYGIGFVTNSNLGPTRYYYDSNLFSEGAKAQLLGTTDTNPDLFFEKAKALSFGTNEIKPNGTLAAIELAFHYADMATAIRKGLEPNFVVLAQWRKNAEQFMGKGAMPTSDQCVVLEAARDYLEL